MLPRRPLEPIAANRRRRNELSPFERGRICQARADGKKLRVIAGELGHPIFTIESTLKKADSRINGHTLPRASRPTK